ncbi:MAG: hypothetical protein ACMUIU_10940 [bacterium]
MKRCTVLVVFMIIFLALNSTSYAQTYDFQRYYDQTFIDLGAISSSNSWTILNQGDYLTNYSQSLYNYQNPASFLRSSDFNLSSMSGWLNHPPVPVYSPTSPMVIKAGQSSSFNYWVIDPDADQLYSSSSFGSTGQYMNRSLGWSFSPNFPGQYLMEAVVYEERGGFAVMRSPVYVKPWWSF